MPACEVDRREHVAGARALRARPRPARHGSREHGRVVNHLRAFLKRVGQPHTRGCDRGVAVAQSRGSSEQAVGPREDDPLGPVCNCADDGRRDSRADAGPGAATCASFSFVSSARRASIRVRPWRPGPRQLDQGDEGLRRSPPSDRLSGRAAALASRQAGRACRPGAAASIRAEAVLTIPPAVGSRIELGAGRHACCQNRAWRKHLRRHIAGRQRGQDPHDSAVFGRHRPVVQSLDTAPWPGWPRAGASSRTKASSTGGSPPE